MADRSAVLLSRVIAWAVVVLGIALPSVTHASPTLELRPAGISDEVIAADQDEAGAGLDAAQIERSFFRGWKGNVEGGLNGSSGNSDNMSLRFGVAGVRDTRAMKTSASLGYTYATSDGEKTKSRAVFEARNDWNLSGRWVIFAQGKVEFDEFQDWDWRLSGFVGPGYYFIRNERTNLMGRVGAGLTREIGGSRNEIIPEGLVGFDFDHKLTEREKVFVSAEWLPDLSELWEYRANARAGWEVLIDPEVNMSLKVGVENRYNHNPGPDRKKNDFEYFMVIGWNF